MDLEKLLSILEEVINELEYDCIGWNNIGEDSYAVLRRIEIESKLEDLEKRRSMLIKQIRKQKRKKTA